MSIDTMKRALEALDVATTPLRKDRITVLEAKDALRAAITEAERQEPVACQYAKDVGMPEYQCVGKCQYSTPQPAPAWQPIETAPKDGDEILICTGEGCRYVVSYHDIFSSPWRIRNDQGLNEHVPTHWMPLPNTPNCNVTGAEPAGGASGGRRS